MKKPITIGVIAVIVAILVTSAVDYSAIGAKPIDQIHLQNGNVIGNGIISCPNGDTLVTDGGSVSFTEHIENEARGSYNIQQNNAGPQKFYSITLWTGEVQSGKFAFTGIGRADFDLAEFCDIQTPFENTIATIWGECGNNETVHFESDEGYSGSFTGNILCV